MEEHFLDVDDECERRPMSVDDELVEEGRVSNEGGFAVDSERIAAARNHKDQAGVATTQNVVKGVGAAVSRTFGNDQSGVAQHVSKTGGVTLRRDVATTVGVRRRHETKWGRGQPFAMKRQNAILGFVCHAGGNGPEDFTELVGGAHRDDGVAIGRGRHGRTVAGQRTRRRRFAVNEGRLTRFAYFMEDRGFKGTFGGMWVPGEYPR